MCNFLFPSALAAIDNMKNANEAEEKSSDGSTIDIMSSGEENIDITNDLDPPESPNHYITDVNSSEIAQE